MGGLDIEQSIKSGRPWLKPGLLGQANRGFLYVDEVNLLEPYLAHLLLDAAETGRLYVEREGISQWHPAKVALVGTMNPEEGALGPQFMDRFALTVNVSGEQKPETRAEIVRRRLEYEADPAAFRKKWSGPTARLAARILDARKRLTETGLSNDAWGLVTSLAREALARGHRADLALARGARALAAWHGMALAGKGEVAAVADMVLAGRTREAKKEKVQVQVMECAPRDAEKPFEKVYIPPSAPPPPECGDPADCPDGPLVERMFSANERFEVVTPVNKRGSGAQGTVRPKNLQGWQQRRGAVLPVFFRTPGKARGPGCHTSSRRAVSTWPKRIGPRPGHQVPGCSGKGVSPQNRPTGSFCRGCQWLGG